MFWLLFGLVLMFLYWKWDNKDKEKIQQYFNNETEDEEDE